MQISVSIELDPGG